MIIWFGFSYFWQGNLLFFDTPKYSINWINSFSLNFQSIIVMFAPLSQRITSFAATCHRSARAKQQGRQVVRQSAVLDADMGTWERERHMERAKPHSLSLSSMEFTLFRWLSFRAQSFPARGPAAKLLVRISSANASPKSKRRTRVLSSPSGSLPRKCVPAAWKGKLGQFSVQFGSGLQFNSTAKTDQNIFERAKSHTEAKQQQ